MAIDIDSFDDEDIIHTLYVTDNKKSNGNIVKLFVVSDPLRDKIMYDIRTSGLTVERYYKFSNAVDGFNKIVEYR